MPVGFQVIAETNSMKSDFYFQRHYKMKKQVRILLLIVVPKLLLHKLIFHIKMEKIRVYQYLLEGF